VRDDDCHILGFTGSATRIASAPYADGGVAYGPGDVLFLARWPNNQLGLLPPGSDVTAKAIDLGPLGVASSISGLGFVPEGFGGAGALKAVNYGDGIIPSGQWYDLAYQPDGAGLFEITSATRQTEVVGGP